MSYQAYNNGQWVDVSDSQMMDNLTNGWGWVTRENPSSTTTTTTTGDGSGGGGSEASSVEIPEGTYEYSKSNSSSGLPDYATDYVKSWLGSFNNSLIPATTSMASYLTDSKPFDWATNLNNNLNWYNEAGQGTKNSLYTTLMDTLAANTSSVGSNLNASGLAQALPSAAPVIYRDALKNYASESADINKWAAEQAATLANAMNTGQTNQYSAASTGLKDIIAALASLLSTTQQSESSSITENPLQPYELMLSQWS